MTERFPSVLATVNDRPISRDAVFQRFSQLAPGGLPAAADDPRWVPLIRRMAEQEVYLMLVRELLQSGGIEPSSARAWTYLNRIDALLPPALAGRRALEYQRLAARPEFQLNAALHDYFSQVAPEEIAVSDQEVERAYRERQQEFRLPESFSFGIIQVPSADGAGRARLDVARDRLRQGESFRRIAEELTPDGVTMDSVEIFRLLEREQVKLKEHEVSPVLQNDGFFLLVKLEKVIPSRYLSLAETTPYLREQLAARKTGKALEKRLLNLLSQARIQYTITP